MGEDFKIFTGLQHKNEVGIIVHDSQKRCSTSQVPIYAGENDIYTCAYRTESGEIKPDTGIDAMLLDGLNKNYYSQITQFNEAFKHPPQISSMTKWALVLQGNLRAILLSEVLEKTKGQCLDIGARDGRYAPTLVGLGCSIDQLYAVDPNSKDRQEAVQKGFYKQEHYHSTLVEKMSSNFNSKFDVSYLLTAPPLANLRPIVNGTSRVTKKGGYVVLTINEYDVKQRYIAEFKRQGHKIIQEICLWSDRKCSSEQDNNFQSHLVVVQINK